MVSDPADYRWSSYRANALGEPNALLSPHPLYLALAFDPAQRLAAYRALFSSALDDAPLAELRLALNQNQPLGNDRFYADIAAVTGQRREPRIRASAHKLSLKRSVTARLRETVLGVSHVCKSA
jgi:putative transposase